MSLATPPATGARSSRALPSSRSRLGRLAQLRRLGLAEVTSWWGPPRRAWLLVPAMALAFGIVADLYTLSSQVRYSASTLVQLDAATVPPNESLDTVDEQEISTQSLVMNSEAVTVKVIDALQLDQSVQSVQRRVAVRQVNASRVLDLTVSWDSPEGAASVANAFATQYLAFRTDQRDQRLSQFTQEGDQLGPGPIGTVLTPAVATESPSGPRPALLIVVSTAVGLLAGIAVCLFWSRRRAVARRDTPLV